MCRIRTIRETAKYMKSIDPETRLTERALRNLVASGEIPYLKTGKKYLINLDVVLEMFGDKKSE